MISIFSIMKKVQKLQQGISVKLSDSEIVSVIINLSDARKNLDHLMYSDLYSVYKKYSKDKVQNEYNFDDYMNRCEEIIDSFEVIAPYEAFNGQDSINFKRDLINVSPKQFMKSFYELIFQEDSFMLFLLNNFDKESDDRELYNCNIFAIIASVELLSKFLPKVYEFSDQELGELHGYSLSLVLYEKGYEDSFIDRLFDLNFEGENDISDFFTKQNIENYNVFDIKNLILGYYKYLLKKNKAIKKDSDKEDIKNITNDCVNTIEGCYDTILSIRNELLRTYSIVS